MEHKASLLSVVVPTRNRFDYVQHAIRSILKIPDSDFELVVEDNSDSDQLESWVRDTIRDHRLNYHHSTEKLSMTENYDRAMGRATGEYVCVIGDDDGVSPRIVDATRWAKANGFDALVPLNSAHFVWPDLELPAAGAIRPGELRLTRFTGECSFPTPELEIRKCARDAGQCFHSLPKVYYGIVRRDCMQRVKEKTGTFFPGVSPDMAVALAIANYVQSMCQIDYPIFLPGSSARSNAGMSGMNKHIGRLGDQPHLPTDVEQNWSAIVPCFYSVQTIWAEAAVSALRLVGRTDVLREFNVPKLYADCLMWHPAFAAVILRSFYPALRAIKRGALRGTAQFIYRFAYLGWLRAESLGRRILGRPVSALPWHSVGGLENIDEAVQALCEQKVTERAPFDRIARALTDC